jgi:hypothetical protein
MDADSADEHGTCGTGSSPTGGRRVMVIGGADETFTFLDSAEIYDPRTGKWSFTAPMNEPRFEDFTAVLLPGRKVLVAGGSNGSLKSAEIYDQKTNTWTPTGSMNVGRGEFATVVLNNGRVLAVGGVTIWFLMGYYMVIFLSGLQEIPREYYEAAQIDGAKSWTMFTRITLPCCARRVSSSFWFLPSLLFPGPRHSISFTL